MLKIKAVTGSIVVYGKCVILPPCIQYTISTLCYMNRPCNLPQGTISKQAYEEVNKLHPMSFTMWVMGENELIINYGINCHRICEQNNIFQISYDYMSEVLYHFILYLSQWNQLYRCMIRKCIVPSKTHVHWDVSVNTFLAMSLGLFSLRHNDLIIGLKAHFIVSPPTIMISLSKCMFHKTMSS